MAKVTKAAIAAAFSAERMGHAAQIDDLDDAVRLLQDAAGIQSGDVAGVHFTQFDDQYLKWQSATHVERIEILREYMQAEMVFADVPEQNASVVETTQFISADVLARLCSEMSKWSKEAEASGGMSSDQAFRYSMFHQRLVAAEYGRPDAVEWACQWYAELIAQEAERIAEAKKAADDYAARRQEARDEIARGQSGNPNFQFFLDTLENPEQELYSDTGRFLCWKYLCWIGPIIGAYERSIAGKDLSIAQRQRAWKDFVVGHPSYILSNRVKLARQQVNAN